MTAAVSAHPLRPRASDRKAQLEVLPAKIAAPELPASSISRTALVNRLRTAPPAPLLVISAPGGYGKTTVLGQWAARDGRPFAWLSLDERDNDPVVLLRGVAAALETLGPLAPGLVQALNTPGASIWESAVPRLGSTLASVREPIVLVLDDAHVLGSSDALEVVSVIVDNVPSGSLLVLSGRVTPRLPISALRAGGRLVEVGVERLALDRREAQRLLQTTGVDVTLAQTTALVQRCEGWPAGLYLAGLALSEEDPVDREEQVAAFRGDDRHVADYFRGEYLAGLRPATLRFLRRTSVLERMSGPLCDAVLDDAGSARELEKIERENIFVVPLDRTREWFRYHELFRGLLRRELLDTEPELVPTLHLRAADWHEAHGDLESALEHATAAGDEERAARILTAIALPVYFSGRGATVDRWLDAFDREGLERFPGVAVIGGWIHALRGRAQEAQDWLAAAERGAFAGRLPDGSTSVAPWLSVLRAAMCRDGVEQMLKDAESALDELPARSLARPSALLAQGAAYVLLGDDERGDAILRQAATEADVLGATETRVLAMSERSLVASSRGDAAAAEELALEANALVESSSLDGYPSTAMALAASARADLRHARWEAARAHLAKAQLLRPLRESAFPWLAVQTGIELARSYVALRDRASARALVTEIVDVLGQRPDVGVLSAQADELRAAVDEMHDPGDARARGLTGAELRLLPYLATHLSFREIGERLFVSRNTIKTQAISVYRKLGVSNRSDAINRAGQLGLVEPSSTAA
jgi:LuxR family maltose regulon positive regulatory protein